MVKSGEASGRKAEKKPRIPGETFALCIIILSLLVACALFLWRSVIPSIYYANAVMPEGLLAAALVPDGALLANVQVQDVRYYCNESAAVTDLMDACKRIKGSRHSDEDCAERPMGEVYEEIYKLLTTGDGNDETARPRLIVLCTDTFYHRGDWEDLMDHLKANRAFAELCEGCSVAVIGRRQVNPAGTPHYAVLFSQKDNGAVVRTFADALLAELQGMQNIQGTSYELKGSIGVRK